MIGIVLLTILPIGMVGGLLCALPNWHRGRLFFGVTTGPEFGGRRDAERIARLYRWGVVSGSLAAVALSVAALSINASWLLVTGLLLQPAAAAAAFAWAHKRTLPYAAGTSSVRIADLQTEPERFPGGWMASLPPFLILAAAALYARLNWLEIPDRFPIHWGIDGRPDGWSHRTWPGVYGPVLIGAVISLGMMLLGWAILDGTRRGGSEESRNWRVRCRRATLRLMVAMAWLVSLLFGFIVISPVLWARMGLTIPFWPVLLAILVVTGLFVWPLIRLNMEPGSGSDGTPDECWKWGGIYYNPDDPALMVERRFGVGYTFNFGNRMSWWCMAGIAVAIMSLIVVSRSL